MINVFDNKLMSKQATIQQQGAKEQLLMIRKNALDSYMIALRGAIKQEEDVMVQQILTDMFCNTIGLHEVCVWLSRLRNGETTLNSFIKQYEFMSEWGFTAYHR